MSTASPAVKAENKLAAPAAKPATIRQHLESPAFLDAVKKALPRHLTPDRFIRVAITAMTKTPKLAQCDQASFFGALLSLSQFGLEPDGRRAHLIPFENRKRGVTECQLIIDWKGLAELAMRSGIVANLHADIVREGDLFDYSCGKIKSHVPWFLRRDNARPDKPGEVFAVYSIAEFRDGSTKADVMSLEEVDAIRARSRAGQAGPWVTDYNEMAKKTVFRRLSKWLPLSPEFRDALDIDDELTPPKNITPLSEKVAGGLSQMVDGQSAEAIPAETEAGASTDAAEDVPYTDTDRERIIGELKELMLNLEVAESKLWQYAVTGKHVPEGVDELWALPTAILEKLRAAVPTLSTKKGVK
jgi:recombination protein RecT